ncbi:hypothetical protein NL676_008791 [Syzygium grande]|nr:hypothetical protein NL676_008791 [Syzygium grande]
MAAPSSMSFFMMTTTPSPTKLLVRGEFLLMTRNYGRGRCRHQGGLARASADRLGDGSLERALPLPIWARSRSSEHCRARQSFCPSSRRNPVALPS